MATGKINHVFEWGAVGINDAPGATPINPTSPMARLWTHQLVGRGAVKSIDFQYRASHVPVPLPDADSTGIDAEYLSGDTGPKRRHVFHWKAPIMELGIAVNIKPKYAKALFIPLRGNPMTDNEKVIERGFAMTSRAVTMVPGEQFAGEFSKFWIAWWNTEGRTLIEEAAQKAIADDSMDTIATTGTEARRYVGGAKNKPFSLQVSLARNSARLEIAERSKRRRRSARLRAAREDGQGGSWNK